MFTAIRKEHRHRPGPRGCPPEEKSQTGLSAVLRPARGQSEQVGQCQHQRGGAGQHQCGGEEGRGQSEEHPVTTSAPATSLTSGGQPPTQQRERENLTKVTDDVR